MEFIANLEQLHMILKWITDELKSIGVESGSIHRIELASEEALVNIMNHAYQGRSEKVEIKVESFANSHVEISFIDSGPPFNPLDAKPADLNQPIEKREIGGLGIHLIRNCVDDVRYMRDGEKNRLIFTIRFSQIK